MRLHLATAVLALSAAPAIAQQKTYTAADYARAERFMAYNTSSLVFGARRSTNLAP